MGEIGQNIYKMQTLPQRVLLFKKDFFLVLISNLIHGVTICTRSGILVNNTFQKTAVTRSYFAKTRSISWKLQMLSNTVFFFFLQGLQEGDKYTLNLKLSNKRCLYILTGLQTWETAEPLYS